MTTTATATRKPAAKKTTTPAKATKPAPAEEGTGQERCEEGTSSHGGLGQAALAG